MSAVAFLAPHFLVLQNDYVLSVVANTQDTGLLRRLGVDVDIDSAPIERAIRPLRDLRALWSLYRLFRRQGFDAVHSITPKAGLLAMLAAWLARVPVRVHWFTGQVWATRTGLGRWGLKLADRLIATLATHALVDSSSQRDFLLGEGVLDSRRVEVLADGSVCGVDGERFRPNANARASVRTELGIPNTAVLLLYLGRLNRDKGIADLAAAFASLVSRFPDLWLLLVGPDEESIQARVQTICTACPERVRFAGFTDRPERFMAAADIFCLPSYREGFGSSVIEAAACGVPAVASRIYGLTDAVREGETGLLHPPGDIAALTVQIERLVDNAILRRDMGEVARMRALRDFSQTRLTGALRNFYVNVLGI